jgi:glyoxalase family protein
MTSPVLGLHHVTATVNDAQADVDFCVSTLGLRLVKKTVNFDNHHVYHFYYGDETGTPGTIWTTFPYKGHGVRVGARGAGQITVTSFSVPDGSLEFWRTRLRACGCAPRDDASRFGEQVCVVADPSGLEIALVATGRDERAAHARSGVPAGAAIRGLHSVTMNIAQPAATIEFMRTQLGFAVVNEMEGRTRMGVGGDTAGHLIDVVHSPAGPRGVNGLGTVHHVAMAVATADDQRQMRDQLLGAGCTVTDILDRQYFTSIYFREPGGVLFEIATMRPGFLVDEPTASLGTSLKLPPWEEPNRPMIEAGLSEIRTEVRTSN